ncbi:hypothetical protein CVIRNUC_007543 [Coccomyxa viridis]|uniref:Uncharacterized protein n=1 Tax=Coccomyxa viridis TaxID=1274662 RepID=A0AAV1IEA7_9CHLO|nr:hypothetical protein CVIRNUC_007543 [Coccomyxa viridis]
MGAKTYFIMLQGSKKTLLSLIVDILPEARVLWAGTGDWMVDAPWFIPPTSPTMWDLALVLETAHDTLHVSNMLQAYATQVTPTQWKPTKEDDKKAENMDPANEPRGVQEVMKHNWHKVFNVYGLLRYTLRVVRIMTWLLLCIVRRNLFQPFYMINLLKFRDGPGEDTYNEYRDAAGKMLMAKGGYMAFIGNMKAAGPKSWDEVMVVAYKSRWQFFRMALLTPTYWPLAWLRDEALSDGMLYATSPCLEDPI